MKKETCGFVNETGISYDKCKEIFQSKQGLLSHMISKHEKYVNLSSDDFVSVIKKDTTSVSAATVLPEGLTITTDKDISSTVPAKFSVNTLSSFVDSLTSIATDFTQSAFKFTAKVRTKGETKTYKT